MWTSRALSDEPFICETSSTNFPAVLFCSVVSFNASNEARLPLVPERPMVDGRDERRDIVDDWNGALLHPAQRRQLDFALTRRLNFAARYRDGPRTSARHPSLITDFARARHHHERAASEILPDTEFFRIFTLARSMHICIKCTSHICILVSSIYMKIHTYSLSNTHT